jgi:hypothetical protein
MSVIESNRTKSELETAVKARELACYTLKITANEKIFLPQYRSALTDTIIQDSIDIYRFVWLANNIRVGNNREKRDKRLQYQLRAKEICNDLLALIGIAKPLFHLTSKRIEYWIGLIINVRGLIEAWSDKDRARYKDV